jgi:Domain of unknown function (DUF4157)
VSDSNQQDPNADLLSDELAKKYDPERLLRMVSRRAGKGERLDHSIREKYEKRFGVDLGHVRVYTGEFAEEFNRKRSAYAVTIGSTGMILMGGSPEKSMGSAAGQALLAHELTHVAQAHKGLHKASTGGMPFAEEHEAEAEAVEQSVAESGGSHDSTNAAAHAASAAVAAKEAMDKAIEKIKERVQEMAADAARNQQLRNGIQRRA